MGDSTEEMLNVTIKRLEAIMVHFTPEEALEAEAHNLIDAAIVILKSSREDMDAGKATPAKKSHKVQKRKTVF